MRSPLTRSATAVLTVVGAIAFGLAACSPAGSSPASSAPSSVSAATTAPLPEGFPVGSWAVTITPDDLRAGGITDEPLLEENTGTFTMTLGADGTWSTVQETDAAVRWPVFQGTFSAVGENGFEQVTTFPPDFAGDVVRFDWSVVDGDLVLRVPEPLDPVMPILIETHPWEPVG